MIFVNNANAVKRLILALMYNFPCCCCCSDGTGNVVYLQLVGHVHRAVLLPPPLISAGRIIPLTFSHPQKALCNRPTGIRHCLCELQGDL